MIMKRAFSLGLIEGAFNSGNGFSSGTSSVSFADRLTFSNTISSDFGGKFQGDVPQGHCIPNYHADDPNGKKTSLAQLFDTNTVPNFSQ